MSLPIFLAHGTLGSWDEIALLALGLLIGGYLLTLLLVERRNRVKHAKTPPQDDYRLD